MAESLSDQLDPQLIQAQTPQEQFLRAISLVVYGANLTGFNLSNLRIKFSIKRTTFQSPNIADIRVYNLSPDVAQSILANLNPPKGSVSLTTPGHVSLSAGYQNNFGVIFQGNIKQIILGRESAIDTFVDIIAADGERAYNFATVNATLGGSGTGATPAQQLDAIVNGKGGTANNGVTLPETPASFLTTKLVRGKTLYGQGKKYLRTLSQTNGQNWSIQDGQLTFIPNTAYLPGTAVVLTSKTGMIGTPEQTSIGVNIKCLINPFIKMGTVVKIDNASVAKFKIDLSSTGAPVGKPGSNTEKNSALIAPDLNADGYYAVFLSQYEGDTRGVPWYLTLSCSNVDHTLPPSEAVQT